MKDYNKMKTASGITDLTAYDAIRNIDQPSSNIEDWNQEDGTFIIHLSGNRPLGKQPYKLDKTELKDRFELLAGTTIHRNTLLNWGRDGLFPRGVKKGRHKLFPVDAPYELYASWLLVNGPLLKCSYPEAGEIRLLVRKARDNGTIEDWLLPFLKPGESTKDRMEKDLSTGFDDFLKRERALFWLRYRLLSETEINPLDGRIIITYLKVTKLSDGSYKYSFKLTLYK